MFRCRFGLRIFLTIACVLFIFSHLSLAADVSGIIETDTTWTLSGSPYRVMGNIQVSEDAALTIEPGVSVRFQRKLNAAGGFYIKVEGALSARGTLESPIIFTAEDRLFPWGGIVFLDQSSDWDEGAATGSILENCVIEFAGNVTPYGTACIFTFSAQPMIRNNIIRYGSSIAIAATDILLAQSLSGHLQILSNRIHDHDVGIQLNLEGARIENNYFINNAQAIVLRTSSNDIDMKNNTIINPEPDAPGDGINLSMDADQDDNGVTTYLWEQTGGVPIALDDPSSPYGTFTAPDVGASVETLVFDLTVTDDDGLQSTESVEILVIGTNEPPVANAGGNVAAEIGVEVKLNAANSFDPDKGISSYLWEQTVGTVVSLLPDATVPDPTFIAPSVAPEGEILTFQVTVTDTEGLEASDTVDVLVFDTNIPPIANAGTDFYVYKEVKVRLDGSNSVDTDGSIASYAWVQTAGTSVTLEDANTSRPTFLTPEVGETEEDLVFQLTVTDNEGLEGEATVTYTVFGEKIPPFSIPASTQTVLQGETAVLSGFNSLDLDRSAVVAIESNLINCASEEAGLININLADPDAGYDVSVSGNQFVTSEEGGLAVYLYGWPTGISDPDLILSENWWGTTDMVIIDTLIYDGGEDFNLPLLLAAPADIPPVPIGSTLTYPSMADAGPDITASADLEVALDGSGTHDPDGIAVYAWTQTDGPAVTLKNADSATASFITPLGGDEGETLIFQLKVKVGDAYEDTDDALVTVSPDEDLPTVDLNGWPTCFVGAIFNFKF